MKRVNVYKSMNKWNPTHTRFSQFYNHKAIALFSTETGNLRDHNSNRLGEKMLFLKYKTLIIESYNH